MVLRSRPSASSLKTSSTPIYSTPAATTLERVPPVSINQAPNLILVARIVDNAKIFKEELLKRNVKNSNAVNLQTLRLGINSIIALSNSIQSRPVEKLQLADNAITDYGMHAIKNIINSTRLISLNLASNMISGEGLELFLDDLITNTSLKHIDLGVVESSMRKNSLGI